MRTLLPALQPIHTKQKHWFVSHPTTTSGRQVYRELHGVTKSSCNAIPSTSMPAKEPTDFTSDWMKRGYLMTIFRQ
ncbi:hypothetical protein V9T40_003800 [Parthenolecanium corni]|uniref:Uncharacterized protein n=1 Tax=Parthenolecanium corni TaxID=536013 RepID=A0AAN9Y982_9HEMI